MVNCSARAPLLPPALLVPPHLPPLHALTPLPFLLRAAGQSWEYEAASLMVRFVSAADKTAQVSVCRKGGHAETGASCAAGLDWDCNGLMGTDDPACRQARRQQATKLPPLEAGMVMPRRPAPQPLVRRPQQAERRRSMALPQAPKPVIPLG